MRTSQTSKILVLSLLLAGGCTRNGAPAATPAAAAAAAPARTSLQIGLTTLYVDDQEKAHRFYTEVLGFAVKDDVSNEGFRWLTVTSPDDPDGCELQLALADDPAAKAYQQARFAQQQPALMFFSDDLEADCARIRAAGGDLAMPPTAVTGSTIAQVHDTVGNLLQLTQLARW